MIIQVKCMFSYLFCPTECCLLVYVDTYKQETEVRRAFIRRNSLKGHSVAPAHPDGLLKKSKGQSDITKVDTQI